MVAAGETLGSYELERPLGRGGMGEVWRARHALLGRPIAIKVIKASALSDDPAMVDVLLKRFAREAQAMSRLSSPHTVQVHDFGTTDDGSFYYAMELLDGVDLRTLVERSGPLPPERVVYLLLQACESLAEAHRAGLVHRDVKPANLHLCRVGIRTDFLKVLDFGLVKSLDAIADETQLTTAGAAAGSPAFMPPEIVLGEEVDARTDVYALGAVAFWLLTGRLLFDEKTAIRTLMAQVDRAPEPPSRHSPEPVPELLDAMVLACLAKDPARRPASVEALARDLVQIPLPNRWDEGRAGAWWKANMPPAGADAVRDTAPSGPPVMPGATDATMEASPAGALAVPAPRRVPATPLAAKTSEPPKSAVDLGESRVPRPRKAPMEAERDRVVGRLQDAFGEGDLSLSEYDERLELAERARNEIELNVVTKDLPATVDAPVQAETPNLPAPAAERASGALAHAPTSTTVRAIFGGVNRTGPWIVPRKLKARALFGGVELDLRNAELTAEVTEIHCRAVFGGVDIVVPPGIYLEVTGMGIFGGFDSDRGKHEQTPIAKPAKIVRITGQAVFGGVSVRVREVGEPDGWFERIRHHREGRRGRERGAARLEAKRDEDREKYW